MFTKISILLIFISLCWTTSSIAQDKLIIGENPPGLGIEIEQILIFQIISGEEINRIGFKQEHIDKVNSWMEENANAIYKGKIEFLTTEEVANLDLSTGNYKYFFAFGSYRTGSGTPFPSRWGVVDISTGQAYTKNSLSVSNLQSELKSEIKWIEKARKENANY